MALYALAPSGGAVRAALAASRPSFSLLKLLYVVACLLAVHAAIIAFLLHPESEPHQCQGPTTPVSSFISVLDHVGGDDAASHILRSLGQNELAVKYSLHFYQDGAEDAAGELELRGRPVLFAPGHGGGFEQVRQLAAEAWAHSSRSPRSVHLDVFTIDQNAEYSGFHGNSLLDQAEFLNEAVKYILELYRVRTRKRRSGDRPYVPDSVIMVGHSMGGMAVRTMLTLPNHVAGSVQSIYTFATPHVWPPAPIDKNLCRIYTVGNREWRGGRRDGASDERMDSISLVSIVSSNRDTTVNADYSIMNGLDGFVDRERNRRSLSVFATGIPFAWVASDHNSIVACPSIARAVVASIYAGLDGHELLPAHRRIDAAARLLLPPPSSADPLVAVDRLQLDVDYDLAKCVFQRITTTNTSITLPFDQPLRQKRVIYEIAIDSITAMANAEFFLLTDRRIYRDLHIVIARPDARQPVQGVRRFRLTKLLSPSAFTFLPYAPTFVEPLAADAVYNNVAYFGLSEAGLVGLDPRDVLLISEPETLSGSPSVAKALAEHTTTFPSAYYDSIDRTNYLFDTGTHDVGPPLLHVGFAARHAALSLRSFDTSFYRLLFTTKSIKIRSNRGVRHRLAFPKLGNRLEAIRLKVQSRDSRCVCSNGRIEGCNSSGVFSKFWPIIGQHKASSGEVKYHFDRCDIVLTFHDVATVSWLWSSLNERPKQDRIEGFVLELWLDDSHDYAVSLSLDWFGFAGQIFKRYAIVLFVFSFAFVLAVFLSNWSRYLQTGVYLPFLSALVEFIPGGTLAIAGGILALSVAKSLITELLSRGAVDNRIVSFTLRQLNYTLVGYDDHLLLLPILFMISATIPIILYMAIRSAGQAVIRTVLLAMRLTARLTTRLTGSFLPWSKRPILTAHESESVTLLIVSSAALPSASTPVPRQPETHGRFGIVLLIGCCFVAPFHYAYLIVFLVLVIHCIRLFVESPRAGLDGVVHVPFIHGAVFLLFWLQVLNGAPLLVWIKHVRAGWYSLDDHDPLSILPLALLVYTIRTLRLTPDSLARSAAEKRFLWLTGHGFLWFSILYGIQFTYALYYATNIVAFILLALRFAPVVFSKILRR